MWIKKERLLPIDAANIRFNWTHSWNNKRYKFLFITTGGLLILLALTIPGFFSYIQQRSGKVLYDPLLSSLPATDMSLPIFTLIYTVVLTGIYFICATPRLVLLLMQSYALLLLLRIGTLYLCALEPSPTLVPMSDPFVDRFFYKDDPVTKDLFFSGHISTLFLFCLIAPTHTIRRLFSVGTVLVAIFLLIQHVHYTIDIIAAPAFAYVAYWISLQLIKRII